MAKRRKEAEAALPIRPGQVATPVEIEPAPQDRNLAFSSLRELEQAERALLDPRSNDREVRALLRQHGIPLDDGSSYEVSARPCTSLSGDGTPPPNVPWLVRVSPRPGVPVTVFRVRLVVLPPDTAVRFQGATDGLPGRALVALVARSARRVLPLFGCWDDATVRDLRRLDEVVTAAEEVAAGGAPPAGWGGLTGQVAAVAATAEAGGSRIAAEVCQTVADAAEAARLGDQDPDSLRPALAGMLERAFRLPEAGGLGFDLSEAVLADARNLQVRVASGRWRDDQPVPPSLFGPMWPRGLPNGWPPEASRDVLGGAHPTHEPWPTLPAPGQDAEQFERDLRTIAFVLTGRKEEAEAVTTIAKTLIQRDLDSSPRPDFPRSTEDGQPRIPIRWLMERVREAYRQRLGLTSRLWRPEDGQRPRDEREAVEGLEALGTEIDMGRAELLRKFREFLDSVKGHDFGSLVANQTVTSRIQKVAERLGVSFRCQKKDCGEPSRLRCRGMARLPNGSFQFEHRSDRGGWTNHVGSSTVPELVLMDPAGGREKLEEPG